MQEAPYTTLLEEALEAWQDTREGTIAEVENIPEDRFDFRPADGARSVQELVLHVLEGALLAVGELTRAEGDFRRASYPELVEEHAAPIAGASGKAELLRLLRETHADADRRYRGLGELFMLQRIHRFDGLPGTRLAWLNHAIAHEYYHRGQIALYARLMDEVPALTKRIRGE